MNEITRDPGTPVVANGIVFCGMAGGGQTGTTAELNAVVDAAAEGLRAMFGCDVSIRFNSDRRSGGAWLKHDTGQWMTSDSQVGITAQLYRPEDAERSRRMYEGWGMEWDGPAMAFGVHISIGLANAVLRSGAEVPEDEWRHAQGLDNKPKVWGGADTVAEALDIVARLVDPERLR